MNAVIHLDNAKFLYSGHFYSFDKVEREIFPDKIVLCNCQVFSTNQVGKLYGGTPIAEMKNCILLPSLKIFREPHNFGIDTFCSVSYPDHSYIFKISAYVIIYLGNPISCVLSHCLPLYLLSPSLSSFIPFSLSSSLPLGTSISFPIISLDVWWFFSCEHKNKS